jgi:lysophospholipase L1-like esterase
MWPLKNIFLKKISIFFLLNILRRIENFRLDGLHLSALGHQRIADLIYSEIESALTEAKEYIKN